MMLSTNSGQDNSVSDGIPKIIWMLWLQGWDDAPVVVNACLRTWRQFNSNWDIRTLALSDISSLLDGDSVISLAMSKGIPREALSDIIRIALLRKYGGVWVDSTCYCLKPLDAWLPDLMSTGFFAFAAPGPDRMISSWFLAAAKGNSIINVLYDLVEEYWRKRLVADEYFWLHHLFAVGYRVDKRFRKVWDETPRLLAAGPHYYVPYAEKLKRPACFDDEKLLTGATIPLLKLTHKLEGLNLWRYPKNSVFEYLIQRARTDSDRKSEFPLSTTEWLIRRISRLMHPGLGIRSVFRRTMKAVRNWKCKHLRKGRLE